jgi:hypothetical protein
MKGRAIAYSAEELDWIKANCTVARKEAHALFQKTFDRRDVSLTNFNALCKRKGWLTGRTGRFDPGQIPANKGKKMPFNPNSARTQFKKGDKPHNTKGAGHEMICPKDGYVYLIVAERNPHTGGDTRRVLKHKWLWEQANGPVPEGMCLKCLDGDRTNTDLKNWELIPRALLPRLDGRFGRGYKNAPDEVRPTLLATARLEQTIADITSEAKK